MKKFALALLLCLFGVALFGTNAYASLVTINNPSFEENIPEDGGWSQGWWGCWNYEVNGWEVSEGVWSGGTFRPSNLVYPNGVPDGLNVAYSNLGGSISQVLTETLTEGYIYTLRVYVGNRLDWLFPAYAVQLLAGGNLLSEENSLNPQAGSFLLSTLTYTALSNDDWLGLPLEIRLSNEDSSGNPQVNFDLVTLDASPVPIPAAVLLLGSGIIGLAGFRMKLHKRLV